MAPRYNVILVLLDDVNYKGFTKMGRLLSRIAGGHVYGPSGTLLSGAGANGEWTRFPNAYVNYALCGPSRYSVLSGRWARHHGCLTHNDAGDADTHPESCAAADREVAPFWLPVALQESGYACGAFGKMPNRWPFNRGDDYLPPGFDMCDLILDDADAGHPVLGIAPHKTPPGGAQLPSVVAKDTNGPTYWSHDGPEYFNYYRGRGPAGVQFAGKPNALTNGVPNAGQAALDAWTGVANSGAYVGPGLPPPFLNGMPGRSFDTNTHYATDLFSAKLQEWLTGAGPSGATFHEPFFATMWTKAAHNGIRLANGLGTAPLPISPARHASKNYAVWKNDGTNSVNAAGGGEIPINAAEPAVSFNEDISDKPLWLRNTYAAAQDATTMGNMQKAQWKALQAVDEMLFDLVQLLTLQTSPNPNPDSPNYGIDEPTIDHTVIIMMSDNGFAFGDHRAEGKTIPYEASIRSNMWVRFPGIVDPVDGGPGQHVDAALVSTVDIAPTIAEIAGVTGLRGFDGMSLVNRILDPSTPWRRDMRFEFNTTSDNNDVPNHEGLLSWYPDEETGELWKYVDIPEFTMPAGGPHALEVCPAESEMYNLDAVAPDDDERTNLIINAAHNAARIELKERKDALFSL